jgi:hypothetical protein
MRRCCFDLEVKDSAWGPFVCAVVYDEASNSFHEFTDARGTCLFLAESDYLITFNGLRFDMLILERDGGEAAFATLRAITHLDVWAMYWPHSTLEVVASLYIEGCVSPSAGRAIPSGCGAHSRTLRTCGHRDHIAREDEVVAAGGLSPRYSA